MQTGRVWVRCYRRTGNTLSRQDNERQKKNIPDVPLRVQKGILCRDAKLLRFHTLIKEIAYVVENIPFVPVIPSKKT